MPDYSLLKYPTKGGKLTVSDAERNKIASDEQEKLRQQREQLPAWKQFLLGLGTGPVTSLLQSNLTGFGDKSDINGALPDTYAARSGSDLSSFATQDGLNRAAMFPPGKVIAHGTSKLHSVAKEGFDFNQTDPHDIFGEFAHFGDIKRNATAGKYHTDDQLHNQYGGTYPSTINDFEPAQSPNAMFPGSLPVKLKNANYADLTNPDIDDVTRIAAVTKNRAQKKKLISQYKDIKNGNTSYSQRDFQNFVDKDLSYPDLKKAGIDAVRYKDFNDGNEPNAWAVINPDKMVSPYTGEPVAKPLGLRYPGRGMGEDTIKGERELPGGGVLKLKDTPLSDTTTYEAPPDIYPGKDKLASLGKKKKAPTYSNVGSKPAASNPVTPKSGATTYGGLTINPDENSWGSLPNDKLVALHEIAKDLGHLQGDVGSGIVSHPDVDNENFGSSAKPSDYLKAYQKEMGNAVAPTSTKATGNGLDPYSGQQAVDKLKEMLDANPSGSMWADMTDEHYHYLKDLTQSLFSGSVSNHYHPDYAGGGPNQMINLHLDDFLNGKHGSLTAPENAPSDAPHGWTILTKKTLHGVTSPSSLDKYGKVFANKDEAQGILDKNKDNDNYRTVPFDPKKYLSDTHPGYTQGYQDWFDKNSNWDTNPNSVANTLSNIYGSNPTPTKGPQFIKKLGGAHGAALYNGPIGEKLVVKPNNGFGLAENFGSDLSNWDNGGLTPVAHTNYPGVPDKIVSHYLGDNFNDIRSGFGTENFLKNMAGYSAQSLQKEHMLDWLIGNHDSHGGNFLYPSSITNPGSVGNSIHPIDKGQAFKYWENEKLSPDFHPNQKYGEHEPIYNTMLKLGKSGQLKYPLKPDFIDSKANSLKGIVSNDAMKAKLNDLAQLYGNPEVFKSTFYNKLDNLAPDFHKLYNEMGFGNTKEVGKGDITSKPLSPVVGTGKNIPLKWLDSQDLSPANSPISAWKGGGWDTSNLEYYEKMGKHWGLQPEDYPTWKAFINSVSWLPEPK